MKPTSRAAGGVPAPHRLRVLSSQRDALIEHVDRYVSFVFANHKCRRDTYRAWTAAQEQNAAFEGQLDDPVPLLRSILLGLLVSYDLDADHQAAAPNIAHQLVLAW